MSIVIRNPPRPPRLLRVSAQPPTCLPHRAARPRVPRARYSSATSATDLPQAPPSSVSSPPATAAKTGADHSASLTDLLRPPPGHGVPPVAPGGSASLTDLLRPPPGHGVPPVAPEGSGSLTDLLRPPPGYVPSGVNKDDSERPISQPYVGARIRDRQRHDALLHRLKAHAEKGEVGEAERLLDDMKHAPYKPSREAYEALIAAYLRVGGLTKAEAMFRSLKEAGERPSAFIYSSLIGACVSRLSEDENVARAVLYYKEMEMLNMKPLPVAAHTLMRAILLRKSPHVGLGVKLLRLLVSRKAPLPPETVWQAFITWRLANAGNPEEQRSLWEILALMQQLNIAIRPAATTALLDSRLHLSAPLLLHMLKHAAHHTRVRVIDRLASEDWPLAMQTYDNDRIPAPNDRTIETVRPYGLISFAPSAGELQRAVASLEREAPLTDDDFVASFIAALRAGQHGAPPPLASAERLYALWKQRATNIPTPSLARALQAVLPVAHMQPLALQMWSDVQSTGQPLAPAVLEPLFSAIDAGATPWVAVIFDLLLKANRITAALMSEYLRLTPHKTSRVKEIVEGFDRSVPLSPATLNVLARAAAEELDAATAQELIQQTKYLSFVVEGETWDAVAFMFARMERPLEALRVLQAVQDRSPFGSPDVPSQRTSNALLVALVNQGRYPDATKFYKRMRCQFEITALTTILPLLANADINFALKILSDAAGGRVNAPIPLPLVLRRLCVRMLKSAEEARNPSAKAPIIMWMQKNGVPLTKPEESNE